jgi:DNA-binding protein H-NS
MTTEKDEVSELTADIFALEKQRAEIDRRIREVRNAKRKDAISQIRNLIYTFDVTESELLGLLHRRSSVNSPKYRDPSTGKTWTGQGKPPNWIKDVADRSAYLIESLEQSEDETAPNHDAPKDNAASSGRAENVGLDHRARLNVPLHAPQSATVEPSRPTLTLRKEGIGIR